ncbi:GerAB/ArcD/ProY family transporter [Paenibacillus eucommiae]|uniref:Spore germination protein KB n=1 Tax=Paenibacillus eucommiae TaxID=1355755 RepID=A0ABS4J4Q6_9BACL|nr:endospore germination permease [Paenibacillus eucommiae]MBP1994822.1 spore germination protein KB [Paenibacillus eucommiae]
MLGKEFISGRQLAILVCLFTIGSAILVIPSGQAAYAQQDAWIATILGTVAGIGIVWLYTLVGSLFPTLSLVQLSEKLLGKWLGKVISFLFIGIFFLGGPISNVYYIGSFMTSQIMPETPMEAFSILFVLTAVMGVRLGLETMARTAEILFPWVLLLFFLLVMFISPQIKMDNILPILESGLKSTVPAALTFLSAAALPSVLLLVINPSQMNQPKEARRAFLIGYLMGGMVLIIIVTLCILVLGHDLTTRNTYPSYALAKLINIGDFLQRLEVLMAFIWIITLYFRMSLYYYVTLVAIAQIFNLKDYRPLAIPLGLLMLALAPIEYPTSIFDEYTTKVYWIPYALIAGLIYPLVLLGIARLRKHFQPESPVNQAK